MYLNLLLINRRLWILVTGVEARSASSTSVSSTSTLYDVSTGKRFPFHSSSWDSFFICTLTFGISYILIQVWTIIVICIITVVVVGNIWIVLFYSETSECSETTTQVDQHDLEDQNDSLINGDQELDKAVGADTKKRKASTNLIDEDEVSL